MPAQLRIAFTTKAPNGAPVAPEYLATLRETVQLCVDLGHHVEEADPPSTANRSSRRSSRWRPSTPS